MIRKKSKSFIKRVSILFCVAIMITLFSGCIYMEQDIKNITVVQGIGIDYDKENKEYKLAIEIFDIAQSSGMGESESGNLTKVLKVSGDTVSSALNKVTLEIGKSIVFSHNKVIVLSEDAINTGINSVMDFFLREYRNRSNVSVVVASDCTAADVIEADQGDVSFPARELETLLESGRINGYTTDITVSDLAEMEEDDSTATLIPTVKIRKEDKSKYTTLDGFVIVKDQKMAGKLSLQDARGVLFVNDEVEGGVLNVEDDSLGLSTLKIVQSDTSIKTEVSETAKFVIDIKCVTDVVEISKKTGTTLSEKDSKRLEENAAQHIETIVKNALITCLDECNSDVFGLTRRVWVFYPSFYRENEDSFKTKPNSRDVEVNVEVEIRRTGQGSV